MTRATAKQERAAREIGATIIGVDANGVATVWQTCETGDTFAYRLSPSVDQWGGCFYVGRVAS